MRRANETIYYVRDMDEGVRYWTEVLGMTLIERFDWGFALLDADGQGGRVGLMDMKMHTSEGPAVPRLSINVPDVKLEVERIAAAGGRTGKVQGEDGGYHGAMVYDSEGNPVFLWDDGSGELFEESK